MTVRNSSATLLSCGLLLVLGAGVRVAAAQSAPPAVEVYRVDFEVGDLEDPKLPDMNLGNYLPGWTQRFDRSFPIYMEGSVRSGGHDSARCLRFPIAGGDALLAGPRLALTTGMRLRVSAHVRWDDLGEGSFAIGLRLDAEHRVTLLRFDGAGRGWHREVEERIVPDEMESAQLEIWVDGDPSRLAAAHEFGIGFDDLLVEVVPRVELEWNGTVQRVSPRDERPIRVRSVGFPQGLYHLDFTVRDPRGNELFRRAIDRYVDSQHVMDVEPRLQWTLYSLPRGLYTVSLRLAAEAGWELTDHLEFALAGVPPFPYRAAPGRWGVILSAAAEEPTWLSALGPIRALIELAPPPPESRISLAELPPWFQRIGEFRRAALLASGSSWRPEHVSQLALLFGDIHDWYWQGEASDRVGREIVEALAGSARFLRAGFLLPPGGTDVPAGRPIVTAPAADPFDPLAIVALTRGLDEWSARIDARELTGPAPDATLGTLLFLYGTLGPETVYLDHPEALLIRRLETGGIRPGRALLVWEFVTSFLSGAEFVRLEPWDPQAICAVFRREGAEFLAVLAAGAPHDLALFGGTMAHAYDGTGGELTLRRDGAGRTLIPVHADPVLVSGLDLARVRTLRSLRVSAGKIRRGGAIQPITLSLHNHFAAPVRASLRLELPTDWEMSSELGELRVAADETADWSLEVEVPSWFGIEESNDLEGELVLSLAGGVEHRLPVTLPVPVESELIAITPDLGPQSGKITIANIHDRPLSVRVNIEVLPLELGQTYQGMTLAPDQIAEFPLDYAGAGAGSRLFVGVVVETYTTHVNRVFDIPTQ